MNKKQIDPKNPVQTKAKVRAKTDSSKSETDRVSSRKAHRMK